MIGSKTLEKVALPSANKNDIVSINGLVKEYGSKRVVDELSLTLHRGEILVLLGHNGAGKTTTISMLTGLIKPKSGTAHAFGKDLLADQKNLMDFIGVCPQENVLLEKLTVFENLTFFCKFKDIQDIPNTVEKLLKDFNLIHKKDTIVKDLSGG